MSSQDYYQHQGPPQGYTQQQGGYPPQGYTGPHPPPQVNNSPFFNTKPRNAHQYRDREPTAV